jgi:bifunctional oligoribonuclease and PAP phosphatase NrnA
MPSHPHTVSVPPPLSSLSQPLADAAALIRQHQRFLITGHEHPDGDVAGSTLALAHILWALGKDVTLFNVDPLPFNFEFLSGASAYVSDLPPDATFDVTCLLDCHLPSRAGDRFPPRGWAPRTLIMDHHRLHAGPPAADVLVHDPDASSTGELVYFLAQHLGLPMTKPLAECLYTSLLTDTGGFRYSNTSAKVLRIAADLLGCGLDAWHITSHIYESNPVERLQLLAQVLHTLTLSPCRRLAFIAVTRDMLSGLPPNSDPLLDGFINHARSIRGVEVAAQIFEVTDDTYRISFRSRGAVDVSSLAAQFGGGGHRNAAGCTLQGPLPSIRDTLSAALSALLSPVAP